MATPSHSAQSGTPPVCPGNSGVTRVTPFVHVASVERSVVFYALLGLLPTEIMRDHAGAAFWAAMRCAESEHPDIMFARASGPVDASQQAVLFYMYTKNVGLLRTHLLACGLKDCGRYTGHLEGEAPHGRVFEVGYPHYMENGELRVEDLDGYCVLIGQLERLE